MRLAPLVTPEMTDTLASYSLKEVTHPRGPVRSFLLVPPDWNGVDAHAAITSTTEGVVLQGPLVIREEADGMVSEAGKTLEWFSRKDLSEDEVAEAFLRPRWAYHVAERDLLVLGEKDSRLLPIATAVGHCDVDRPGLITVLMHLGLSQEVADQVGFDFPVPEAGWLVSVQRRFADLVDE